MREITLHCGSVTLVDDEDYESLSSYSWHLNDSGYPWRSIYVGRIKGGYKYRNLLMHRQIMGVDGTKKQIDHINNNPLDNRKCNLRITTQGQNQMNKRKSATRHKHSKYKGINRIAGRFYVRLYKDRKLYSMGGFATEIDAALAYNAMALKHFGEYASLNEVQLA